MWNAQPVIFEDEDEESLKANFIRLCALYPEQDIFEIGRYVFRNQRDPDLRGEQAAMIWNKDLEVKERIRLAKLNGGETEIDSKEARLRKLQSFYDNEDNKLADRIKAMELAASIDGHIVKAVDKNIKTDKRPPRQIIFAQYADD